MVLPARGAESDVEEAALEWFGQLGYQILDGPDIAPKDAIALDVLLQGIFEHHRFLDLLDTSSSFEVDGSTSTKMLADGHQYHAFLEEVRDLPYRNVALELLKKLLNDEIKVIARSNVVQARSFADLLEKSIRRYTNRTIESAQVIQELIELAKQLRAGRQRGEELGLIPEELAFYDALGASDSAVSVLGDEELRDIARELVASVRKNASIDWILKESSRAKLRTIVKRILRRHHFPPDRQEQAAVIVLQQAELFADQWAA